MSVLCKEGLERFWADAKTYFTGTATPLMDGTAAVGSSSKFAREDHVHPSDSSKVDKEAGKGLSTNDFTDALKQKLEGIATMTASEMETGTDTTGKLVTAKDLHDVYVNVTGDTMSGNLTIHRNSPSVILKDTRYTIGTVPSSDVWGPRLSFRDNNGISTGYTGGIYTTTNKVGVQLEANRSVNGSAVYNGVALYIDADGNRTVTVSDAAAWRTALSVYSKTEADNRFVNTTGDTMTGNLTMSSANIKFDNGGYTETISQRTSGGLNVTVTGTLYLKNGSTTEYYLQSSDSYHHHFSTTTRFAQPVLHDDVTYHSDNIYVDSHACYVDSGNLATGTAISSTVTGTGDYYGRDKNDKYIGGVRFVGYNANRYGINLFAQNGTTYNQLSLLVDNSGTRSVYVSNADKWRSAIWPVTSVTYLSGNHVAYRKIGDLLQVWGESVSCGTSWTDVGTLPTGYRPNKNTYFAGICGGNGNRHMSVGILTSGIVRASSSSAATD